ncbi:MAG: DUF3445 domain-containing protein [Chthoniobacteraceae bacterium]
MTSHGPMPDWERLFPSTPHRWQMGLRPAEAPAFFAREPDAAAVLAERARWLDASPGEYAALLDEAAEPLAETARFAGEWGAACGNGDLLAALGRTWEPDFALMVPGEDGIFRLAGGVVCFPSSWALREKLGRPMNEIHAPVPGLNPALARQIDTFLDRLAPGAAWARDNWSLSRDAELNHHPSRKRPRLDATITAVDVWLRIERQLLFKLPETRAVLFGIRVDVHPLASLTPPALAGLAHAVQTMEPAALAYKGLAAARDALLAICSGPSA